MYARDPDIASGYSLTGGANAMLANRLSYSLDLRGPSFNVDTACNSSLLALQLALTAMREGQCTAAIVAGSNVTLTATVALQFLRLQVDQPSLTPLPGEGKVWDQRVVWLPANE